MNEDPSPPLDCYFDFVSPYVYLGLERLASLDGVTWQPRPVVYGVILDQTGLVGPVETDAKRRYTFHDALRCAEHYGIPLVGPPAHPFRSLDALRMVAVLDDFETARALTLALARACWADGRDLTEPDVRADIATRCGLDGDRLVAAASGADAKARLRLGTESALEAGVFGVPTLRLGDELFWGHDRIDQLEARLAGAPAPRPETVESLLRRPAGSVRKAVAKSPPST